MAMTYENALAVLKQNGQEHILAFWRELDDQAKQALLLEIETLDFASIARMKQMLDESRSAAASASKSAMTPADVISLSGKEKAAAVSVGEQAICENKVGVILVAGGQGSRLGFEGPKGCYLLAPITNASLFEIHARKILAYERKYNAQIPFYVMTSNLNDTDTRSFFEKNKYFGLAPERVKFFKQGMWPAIWPDGKVIMETKSRIFRNPDGHGGILTALKSTGMLDDMTKRGLRALYYFQVDNPLVEIADPAFIGVHMMKNADISVKVCAKRNADEGLGVVIVKDGRNMVMEYSDLTAEEKHAKRPDGRLNLLFGSVAIHVFSLDFLKKEAAAALPLHIAHKKIAYCDDKGSIVKPDKPNGYKFEKFIFDVIPDAKVAVNLEFAREEEFSPVKNAEGFDSPEMARRDMMLKFAGWLDACGVKVPRDVNGVPTVKIEIDACYARSAEDLRKALPKNFKISGDVLLTVPR